MCEQFPDLYAVVGWHPSDVLAAPEDLRPELRRLASHPKVVALGETGLDYHRLPSQRPGGASAEDRRYTERQRQLFQQHLEVAAELGLNCVIHQRDALDDLLAIFRPFAPRVRGVFHCFVEDARVVRRIEELDSWVSFTGIVTFKNADKVRETAAAIPLGRFMLETDCPYLAPVPFRGKRCEPSFVRLTAEKIAEAMHKLRTAKPAPYKPKLPMRVTLRFKEESRADAAAKKPGVRRADAFTVECEVQRQCDVVKWLTGTGVE